MSQNVSYGNMSNLHKSNRPMAAKCPEYDPFHPRTSPKQAILNILVTFKVDDGSFKNVYSELA